MFWSLNRLKYYWLNYYQ